MIRPEYTPVAEPPTINVVVVEAVVLVTVPVATPPSLKAPITSPLTVAVPIVADSGVKPFRSRVPPLRVTVEELLIWPVVVEDESKPIFAVAPVLTVRLSIALPSCFERSKVPPLITAASHVLSPPVLPPRVSVPVPDLVKVAVGEPEREI